MSVDLIIGGTSKAGTTALYDILKQSESFFVPARKELHYFSRTFLERSAAGPGDAAVLSQVPRSLDSYLRHFTGKKPGQVAVDVSPSYLFFSESAPLIARDCPDARVFFILRRPDEKVFSQYVHLIGEGRETLTFEEGLDRENERAAAGYSDMWLYARSGFYADAVRSFQEALGKDRVKVVLYDEFRARPDEVLSQLCRFVGVDGAQRFDTSIKANVSGKPRWVFLAKLMGPNALTNFLRCLMPPPLTRLARRNLRALNTGAKPLMRPETRQRLQALYQDDIAKLEDLIGRETGWRNSRYAGDNQ